jgi:hypothetical protein
VATVILNSLDTIQFVNVSSADGSKGPMLVAQAGDWHDEDRVESGVVVDVVGDQAPILTADNARKLARWLQRAADTIEGVKPVNKKRYRSSYSEDEEDDDFDRRY